MRSIAACIALISCSVFGGVNRWTTSISAVGKIEELAVDPANSNVYARTSAGIYRTTDGGQSWRAANDGLPDPAKLAAFVVATDALYAAIGNIVYGSWDGGEHWQRRAALGSLTISILAFDPRAKTLLAGTSGGVYYSTDGGENWITPQTPTRVGQVGQLVVSANVALIQVRSGVLRSRDGGKTWESTTRVAYLFFANPSSDSVYGIAGQTIFVTDDQGNSWTKIPWPNASVVHSLVPAGHDVYATSESGVHVFNSQAKKWFLVASTSSAVHSLAITATSPRWLFAAPSVGVIALKEGDRVWANITDGLPRTPARDVAMSNEQPSTAYATTDGGLLRTDDAGRNWTPLTAISHVTRVAAGPQSPDTAYATASTVMETTDGGATWKGVTPSYASQFAVAPSNPATLYAALADGLMKSLDGGTTWSSITSGIPAEYYDFWYGFQASTLTVDPANDSTLYVGRESGLYKTTHGGTSWVRAAGEQSLSGLVVDPADSSTLYAAGYNAGVRKSVDGGITWTSAGLIDKLIRALAISDSQIYAGSVDGHVYRSEDSGQQWNGFDEGLSRGTVWRIAVDPSATLLYAATAEGLYQFQVADENLQLQRMPNAPLQLPRNSAFVLPVIGKGEGAGRTSFTTDVTLTSSKDDAQQVVVLWLPESGGTEAAASFLLTVPSGVTTISDVSSRFGISGVGSLAFVPADDSVSASARIWTRLPDGRAPISQSITTTRGPALSDHAQLTVTHLRHDSEFRTNAGILNLSNDTHQFTIQINGQRSSGQVTVSTPPWSLVHVAVPDADYGDLSLVAIADMATAFLFYGSLIDRSTLEAQTFIGGEPKPAMPIPPPTAPTEEVWVRGNVVGSATNHCINGALIEVIGDARPSSRAVNQCGQPYDDNYLITGMREGASVTFRVSADGYRTKDFPTVLHGDIDDQVFITFSLDKQ